jgi:hypothetical protein
MFCLKSNICKIEKLKIEHEDIFVYDRENIFCKEIEEELKEIGVRNCVGRSQMGNDLRWMDVDLSKPELDYIEYHVSWHCNLQCKGCGHYSNLQDTPMFGDLEQYTKDLRQIHSLVSNVKKIRLMGGEPLLNPICDEFVQVTRNEFPYADIRVVSNGLLIPNCDEKLLITMRENGAQFDVSQYPPTEKIVDNIIDRCNKYGVNVNISPLINYFFASSDGSTVSDVESNWNSCESQHCRFLYNGKMAVCGVPLINMVMKEKTKFKGVIEEQDIVDLYDPNLTSEEFVKKMNSPISMCKYCDKNNKKFFEWEGWYKSYFSTQMLEKHDARIKDKYR